MKAVFCILTFFVASHAFAGTTLLCSGRIGSARAALAVTTNAQNELTAVVRKQGSSFPFETGEDYQVTEIKKISENARVRIYDIIGEEGDQSYYDARLIVPRSGKVSWVRWQYSVSSDEEVLGQTKVTLHCR